MSRVGYFIGGFLVGAIGTAITAYTLDTRSTCSSSESQELDTNAPDLAVEDNSAIPDEPFANLTNEGSYTA